MLSPYYRTAFKKDVKRAKKRGKKMDKFKQIIEWLIQEKELLPQYCDHTLSGRYVGHRECHIEPDWLLIYMCRDGQLILERTGSHADLF